MAKRSAGVLLYRRPAGELQVLLVHPGGPYWRNRDIGAWQIPKGLIEDGEDAATAARREAEEELGLKLAGRLAPLATVRQAGGKVVEAFALEHDIDPAGVRSNMFAMEWPPGSGRSVEFPEVDAVRWMPLKEARALVLPSQLPLLDALAARLGG